jgi:hypothetical protein
MPSIKRRTKIVKPSEITPNEALSIAKEACIYGFPMVDNYRILYSYFVNKADPEYKGDWNVIHSEARVYTPEDKVVQTPNADTPYSMLGADLRTEPLVLTMPQVDNGRYYSAQFIDLYTFNFFYVGTRSTGNDAGSFLLAGPGWKGPRPEGIKRVIRSETELALVIFRTQLFNPDDIENVKRIQAGYKVQPLSRFLGRTTPSPAPGIDFIEPLAAEQERTSLDFLNIMNFVLQFCSIHPSELELMSRFSRLGIKADRKFYSEGLSPEMHQAIEDGMTDAWKSEAALLKQIAEGKASGVKLFGSREDMENNYLNRMVAAATGIYGNSWEEAIYYVYYLDSAGHAVDTKNYRYRLHFRGGQLPPVSAFWSVTLYELPSQLLSANALNRYVINSSMVSNMQRDADGGLSIYIQHDSPGDDKISNWLPAPKASIKLTLRLYAPRHEVSHWKAPALDRVKNQKLKKIEK